MSTENVKELVQSDNHFEAKPKKGTSQARKKYQKERSEAGREERSTMFDQTEKEKVKEKLGFGFKGEKEILQRLGDEPSRCAVPIAITSRGIGFGISTTYQSLTNYGDARPPSIYTMYRVSLYALEAKLTSLTGRTIPVENYDESILSPKYSQAFYAQARTLSCLPKPVVMLLDAVGITTVFTVQYLPVQAHPIYATVNGTRRLYPLAERITFSYLRETVEALADVNTPREWRRRFWAHNPIPGAIVADDLLMNADEIIPSGYSEDDLLRDTRLVAGIVPALQKFAPKFVGTSIKWDEKGSSSILISSEMGTLRQELRWANEPLSDYYRRCVVVGDSKERWAIEQHVGADRLLAAATLTGEVPCYSNLMKPLFTRRAREISSYRSQLSHEAIMRMVFN